MKVEDEYLDILQNIEFAIVGEYRTDPTLIDMYVLDAVGALLRHYGAEERQHRPPVIQLSEKAARVFDPVKEVCEWRVGRQRLAADDGQEPELNSEPVAAGEIVRCLRRIQKSIRMWNKQGGRQGYLDFVSQFQP